MAEIQVNVYSPTLPSKREIQSFEEIEDLLEWLDEEFRSLYLNLQGLGEGYEVTRNSPDKLKVGMVRYADGTDWNPDGVSGEGLYVYKSTGWTFIA